MTIAKLVRALAAAGVVAVVSFLGAPLGASHSVDFESHNCPTASASPDEEPDVTPTTAPTPDSDAPPAEPTPPPQNCMPMPGERIWGTRQIRFSTSTTATRPMKRIALYVLSQEETIPHANGGKPLLEELYDRNDEVESYDSPFSWNSVEATPYNGTYKIRVHADTYSTLSNDTHRAYADRVDLMVDNPPKVLAAPKIVAKTLGSVTLQWQAASEPDVLSYTVYRAFTKTTTKPSHANLKQIGVTTGPAYRDSDVKPGYHWYAIKVTRRSVITKDTGISSPISPISDAAQVKSQSQIDKENDDSDVQRTIPYRSLGPTPPASRLAGVADAPFKYQLPFDKNKPPSNQSFEGTEEEPGAPDPRGPVLPVAVGMFLVSSALAVGRMPY